ncbi:MAG TPA: hypothetical protein VHO90_10260 [Bacteroidales bacterium]|nr:hypothetical protein [Bacteroidales bacterium]
MGIYNHSPIWMQNLCCTLAGKQYIKTRYGKAFFKWAAFYAESKKWSQGQLKEYQREQLKQLIGECFDTVPYYAEKWKSMGLVPDDVKDISDLSKFPCTNKEDIFNFGDRFVSTKHDKNKLIAGMTGGSTGMPLTRYYTMAEIQRHYAIFWDRMRQGVKFGDPYATFQGKEIVPPGQKNPPYWRENYAAHQRLYSMRNLSPDKLVYYAKSLIETPFVYYQGYVSILTIIAEFMAENGMKLKTPPKAVFCTSEQLTASARKLMEETWNTRVWNEYCQGERCALIRQCEHGNHHAQMDYGVVEYEPIGHEGNYLLAELICTSFIPHASPLIRYRIGDRVLVDEGAKCPCGYPGPIIKAIRGRTGEYILTPDGRKYPHISLIVDMLRNVKRTQVIQDRLEEITVRIVPFPTFNADDEKHLIRCFQDRIGGGIIVKVEHVSELERLSNGKTLSIINRIPGHSKNQSGTPNSD